MGMSKNARVWRLFWPQKLWLRTVFAAYMLDNSFSLWAHITIIKDSTYSLWSFPASTRKIR